MHHLLAAVCAIVVVVITNSRYARCGHSLLESESHTNPSISWKWVVNRDAGGLGCDDDSEYPPPSMREGEKKKKERERDPHEKKASNVSSVFQARAYLCILPPPPLLLEEIVVDFPPLIILVEYHLPSSVAYPLMSALLGPLDHTYTYKHSTPETPRRVRKFSTVTSGHPPPLNQHVAMRHDKTGRW